MGCAVGGCLIRYQQMYKGGYKTKFLYFLNDVIIAAFLGYLCSWFMISELKVRPPYIAITSCVVGNLGAKVLDMVAWYLQIKYKIPVKKDEHYGEVVSRASTKEPREH